MSRVEKHRARILRAAFETTMRDPAFLADARSLNLEVVPVGAAEVEALLREIYRSPPEVTKLAAELVRDGP